MTDLRKIAENIKITPIHEWTEETGVIATLLNAVVEERAELIARSDENIEITLRQAKKKAIRELGLEGVWLGKKG